MKKSTILCLTLLLVYLGSFPVSAYAQMVKGEIVCDDGPLPGVTIHIQALQQGTVTDLNGMFSLQLKETGEYDVRISYIGYQEISRSVRITSGINDLGTIFLEPDELLLGEVVISGTMAPSQRKAYDIKKASIAMMDIVASDAVGKLPDRNAAEAVQRIQGVAVARYHGEADQATVRGTPFAWTSTLFNGSRLPSSNVMGNRSSVLDAVPSELIQYVQVAKALTPDWEGDAIGGSVNFITRTAPVKRKLGISMAGGYNAFSDNGTYNGSLVYGDRFFNDKLGVILVGAIWDRQWGSDSFDVSYNTSYEDAGQRNSINSVMLKRYMGKRQTYGINMGLEYKFNNDHKIFFRGLYDKFNDIRPVYETYVNYNSSQFQYNYRYSYYQTRLTGGEVGGEHQLTSRIALDWGYSNYTSSYFLDTPSTSDQKGLPIATFKQNITSGFNNLSNDGLRYWGFDSPNGVGGKPMKFDAGINDYSEVLDPTRLTLQQLVISQLDNKEHDQSFQLNLKADPTTRLKLKAGMKYRTKSRNSYYGSNFVYLPGAALGIPDSPGLVALSDLRREQFPIGNGYFKGMEGNYYRYIVDPLTKQQLFDLFQPSFLEANGFGDYTSASNATNIYRATENVLAGYIMADYALTDHFRIVGGVRNEYTMTTLKGSQATVSGSPAVTEITPAKKENNYNMLLPMLHLKYEINDRTNLRFAYTRTFVRPNFGDMTPGESMDMTANPIVVSKGNQDLNPTFANNFDLMGEYYFDNVGLLSGGVFYKDIKDVIFTDVSYYTEGGSSYVLTQAKNLQNARLFGFEAGINKRFDFLPGFLGGLGAEVNYTFIDSRVKVPRNLSDGTAVRDQSTLPDQSKNMANIILFYEKSRVMVRLAGNYRGKSVATINQNLGPDYYIWTASNFTVDASATVDLSDKVKVFLEMNNLTNEPLKQFMGDSRRLTSCEWYGVKGQIGLRWDIFK